MNKRKLFLEMDNVKIGHVLSELRLIPVPMLEREREKELKAKLKYFGISKIIMISFWKQPLHGYCMRKGS